MTGSPPRLLRLGRPSHCAAALSTRCPHAAHTLPTRCPHAAHSGLTGWRVSRANGPVRVVAERQQPRSGSRRGQRRGNTPQASDRKVGLSRPVQGHHYERDRLYRRPRTEPGTDVGVDHRALHAAVPPAPPPDRTSPSRGCPAFPALAGGQRPDSRQGSQLNLNALTPVCSRTPPRSRLRPRHRKCRLVDRAVTPLPAR